MPDFTCITTDLIPGAAIVPHDSVLLAPVISQFFQELTVADGCQFCNPGLLFIQQVIVLFIEKEHGVTISVNFQDLIEIFIKRSVKHELLLHKLIVEVVTPSFITATRSLIESASS